MPSRIPEGPYSVASRNIDVGGRPFVYKINAIINPKIFLCNLGTRRDALAITMTNRLIFVLTLLLALAIGVSAADISGKWTAQVPGRGGQARETTFTLKAEGATLTGSVSGAQGAEIPISDGKITGDAISFATKMERGGNTITQTYTGTVAGSEIKMKRESGQGQPVEFVAKRAQ
jgi:hypothetical protein